jgi:hypothetical protein
MISERDITLLLGLPKYADNVDVDKRWKEWIDFETSIMNYMCVAIHIKKVFKKSFIFEVFCFIIDVGV